jgi:tetratricopeptide (TPR) repeat protein
MQSIIKSQRHLFRTTLNQSFKRTLYSTTFNSTLHQQTYSTATIQQSSSAVEKLDNYITQAIQVSDRNTMNQLFKQVFDIYKQLNEKDIENVETIFSEYIKSPEKVYIGYIGRGYLYLYTKQWNKAKEDALILELVDAIAGLKRGGTGITDTKVLTIAFHMLFHIDDHYGDKSRLKYYSDGAFAAEPLFVFTNVQRGKWYLSTLPYILSQQDHREAVSDMIPILTRIIEQFPDYSEAYAVRGQCYLKIGKDEQANLDFQKSNSVEPVFERITSWN